MWFIWFPAVIHCYNNICEPNKCTATQSSTLGALSADKVIDGDKQQIFKECSHTAENETGPAWVMVDLGKEYRLKNITIFYRDEKTVGGTWRPYRFRQYGLEISSKAQTWTQCYKDNTSDSSIPSNRQNITCEGTARYLRIITNYDAPENGEYNITGAILEICEIQVYGACLPGHYGQACQPCNKNCRYGSCDGGDGRCIRGCSPGYYGFSCSQACSKNCVNNVCGQTYGNCSCVQGWKPPYCHDRCNQNCVDMKCDGNGKCIQGCKEGHWGKRCDNRCPLNCQFDVCNRTDGDCSPCKDGYYEFRCEKNCHWNDRCSERKCDKDKGYCINGCKPGYYGRNYCDYKCGNCSLGSCERVTGNCTSCKIGYYRTMCKSICSENCLNKECRQNDGHCSNGCKSGFYGSFCNQLCSKNCQQTTCRQNGKCIGGCKPNWTGDKCDSCDSSHYGHNCSQVCNVNCKRGMCNNITGFCTLGCSSGFYSEKCERRCSSSCPRACSRNTGECEGECSVGKYGKHCDRTCNHNCNNGCSKTGGLCDSGCIIGKFGADCHHNCGEGCISGCSQANGSCTCKSGWQGQNCDECHPNYYGEECDHRCSSNCLNGTCHPNNGSCRGGCKGGFSDEKCTLVFDANESPLLPITAIGGGIGAGLFVLFIMIIIGIFITRHRRGKHTNSKPTAVIFQKNKSSSSTEKKMYTSKGNDLVTIEDPEEEPQIENPEEAVYYNDLSVAKDIAVSDLLKIITQKEAKGNEGFQKEFKMLPYGERFECEIAKAMENMPKNRFKTTFPYDHSRVVLDTSQDFTSDYINANYIENMEGKGEFIACQGPLKNTLVDHWRMIWQEHVEYIVMLTNLIEGPKVKCHQYWPDQGKDLNINPFTVTLVEEKQYAYFVERRMTLHNKKVSGSRTVVQYHYTRWPDHGTPNPLNLIVFHRHFRHKIRSTQNPIIVHCSAGIGRTGTFIAFDVLSRVGKEKGKVNVIEYVKAMRKDRMTMIQNVDQYVFLYHALYEFFRRKVHYIKRDEFLSQYGDINKADNQKMLTNEFNELISLKPKYAANEFKSGKKFSELNFTKSVLPVEQHLVYLTSHLQGRQCYYNAVNVCSFTRADDFLSAQFPVSGAAIDLLRLLTDQESAFLISLNPLSELKELQSWVDGKHNPLKLSPYAITKGSQEVLTGKIRKTNLKISTKEETRHLEIFECLNWSSKDTLPMETSVLTTLIKQISLDRKAIINGPVTVISKDGATCCGVFIAVYNAIEQLQQDDEVDIFTIVQQLQCRRPEMISTKDEYEFCFKAVSDFLNTESVYANT